MRGSWSCSSLRSSALALAALAGAVSVQAAEPLAAPPAGFEELLAGEDVVVDLWFLDRLVGSVRARHAPGTLRFQDPRAVAALLDVGPAESAVAALLSDDLPTNEHLGCRTPWQPPCSTTGGALRLLFSPDDYRAVLWIDPALLPVSAPEGPRFLPASSAGWSYLQTLSGLAAGTFGGDGFQELRAAGSLAHGSARLQSDLALASEGGVRADTVELALDRDAWRFRGGLARATGSGLFGSDRYVGLAAGTQVDTRVDRDALFGNQLEVFLPGRALVEVLRDGRVLDVRTYPAGNQAIETGGFPEGAYDVTLRIRDLEGGGTREERQFFVKSAILPPRDQALFTLEAGVARDVPGADDHGDRLVALASLRQRLAESLGGGVGLRWIGQRPFAEGELQYLAPSLRARLGLAWGAEGYTGLTAGLSFLRGPISLNADIRRLDGEPAPTAALSEAWRTDAQYFCCRGTRVGLRARGTGAGGVAEWGPYAHVPLIRTYDHQLALQAEYVDGRDDESLLLQFILYRAGSRWRVNSQAGWTESDDRGVRASAVAAYDWLQTADDQLDLQALATARESGGRVGAGTHYRGRFGRLDAEIDRPAGDADALGSRYDAGFSVNVAGTAGGAHWGGSSMGAGALQVALGAGVPPGTRFRLLVDDRPRLELEPGQTRTLYLVAYRTYSVRLQALAGPLTAFDASPRRVVLYPGNVERLEWPLERVVTVYGRAVWAGPGGHGTPHAALRLDDFVGHREARAVPAPVQAPRTLRLAERLGGTASVARARIEGALANEFTDAEGYFQADVAASPQALVLEDRNGARCRLALPAGFATRELVSLGTQPCVQETGQ